MHEAGRVGAAGCVSGWMGTPVVPKQPIIVGVESKGGGANGMDGYVGAGRGWTEGHWATACAAALIHVSDGLSRCSPGALVFACEAACECRLSSCV